MPAIQFIPEHLANVNTVLGINNPGANMLRYGCEIEVGWHEERQRDAFLSYLSDAGLGNTLIAKHDGTIDSKWPCEIVTKPLEAKEMLTVLESIGEALEKHSKKGLITQNCGVHFHVSRGPIEDSTIWRTVNAICEDEQVVAKTTKQETSDKPHPSRALNSQFWSLFSLRQPTKHCRRIKYGSFYDFTQTKSHERAIIVGKNSPTYEFRIFRATRSKRVLVSYFEGMLALLAFSKNSDALCTPVPKVEKIRLEELTEYPEYWVRTADNRIIDRRDGSIIADYANGDVMVYNHREDDNVPMLYPNVDILRKLKVLPPKFGYNGNAPKRAERDHYENILNEIINGQRGRQEPSNWLNSFPLDGFLEYIQENKKLYPTLSARMRLSRFTELFARPKAFDTSTPHLEFQSGCLAYDERERVHFTIVKVHEAEDPVRSTCTGITAEEDKKRGIIKDTPWQAMIYHLTHSCPGALEPGGEQ